MISKTAPFRTKIKIFLTDLSEILNSETPGILPHVSLLLGIGAHRPGGRFNQFCKATQQHLYGLLINGHTD